VAADAAYPCSTGIFITSEDAPSIFVRALTATTEHPHKLSEQIVKELKTPHPGENVHSTLAANPVKRFVANPFWGALTASRPKAFELYANSRRSQSPATGYKGSRRRPTVESHMRQPAFETEHCRARSTIQRPTLRKTRVHGRLGKTEALPANIRWFSPSFFSLASCNSEIVERNPGRSRRSRIKRGPSAPWRDGSILCALSAR